MGRGCCPGMGRGCCPGMGRRDLFAATWSHMCELRGLGGPMLPATQQGCGCLPCKCTPSRPNPTPQTLFTIHKCCNKHFSSYTNIDNAILSLAFLLNTDDAMVIALQHLHVNEQHASEKDVFVSMMTAMSIVGKCSDFKKTICVD